jgi:hypothetical protein
MKASLLFGTIIAVLSVAIASTSAQTQSTPVQISSPAAAVSPAASASAATTASPRPTPDRPSLSQRATAPPGQYAAASPTPRAAATATPSTRKERNARVRPNVTPSPAGGAELEGESFPTTRGPPSEAAGVAEKTKPTPSRPHRKPERPETAPPPEGPQE